MPSMAAKPQLTSESVWQGVTDRCCCECDVTNEISFSRHADTEAGALRCDNTRIAQPLGDGEVQYGANPIMVPLDDLEPPRANVPPRLATKAVDVAPPKQPAEFDATEALQSWSRAGGVGPLPVQGRVEKELEALQRRIDEREADFRERMLRRDKLREELDAEFRKALSILGSDGAAFETAAAQVTQAPLQANPCRQHTSEQALAFRQDGATFETASAQAALVPPQDTGVTYEDDPVIGKIRWRSAGFLDIDARTMKILEAFVSRLAASPLGCINFETAFRSRQREGQIFTLHADSIEGMTFGQASNAFTKVTTIGVQGCDGAVIWCPQDDVKLLKSEGLLVMTCTPYALAMGLCTEASLAESEPTRIFGKVSRK